LAGPELCAEQLPCALVPKASPLYTAPDAELSITGLAVDLPAVTGSAAGFHAVIVPSSPSKMNVAPGRAELDANRRCRRLRRARRTRARHRRTRAGQRERHGAQALELVAVVCAERPAQLAIADPNTARVAAGHSQRS
jgi:hypothetical protein